jgi:PilZ domain
MADKRRHVRIPAREPARIVSLDDSPSQITCTITDLSQRGARLSVESTADIPEVFELLIEPSGLRRLCKVAWRSEDEVGVAFQH